MSSLDGQLKPRACWRLTDKGAEKARDKGLISEIDYLSVIHQREQDPNLNSQDE